MDEFKSIVSNLRDAVIVCRNGLIEYANPAFAELLGLEADHDFGQAPLERWVKLREESVITPCPTVTKNLVQSASAIALNGIAIEVEVTGGRAIEFAGTPAELITIRDVTEKRNLEREIVHIANTAGARLARDLHDGLGQELAAIKFQAAALQTSFAQSDPEAAAAVAELLEQIQASSDHVRQMAHGLDTSRESRDLPRLLAKLARNTEARHPVQCSCSIEGSPALAPNLVLHLHRIAQEAVTNAIHHGKTREIEIRLRHEEAACVLSVADQGCGFSHEGSGSGIGIRIMTYRAKEMGGRLEIEQNPAGGTVLRCVFPVTSTPIGAC